MNKHIRTHCNRGHLRPADSFIVSKNRHKQCRECKKIWHATYKQKPNYLELSSRGRVKAMYQLSPEQWQVMFDLQVGVCAICEQPSPNNRKLSVDHNHSCCPGKTSCGKCIRGLICCRCNFGIGSLMDNPKLLRKAADYIETHRKRPCTTS